MKNKNLSLSHVDGLLSRIHLLNHVVERVAALILPKATAWATCTTTYCFSINTGVVCATDCVYEGGTCTKKVKYKYKHYCQDPIMGCADACLCATPCAGYWQVVGTCPYC
jgi:hypothetical protein